MRWFVHGYLCPLVAWFQRIFRWRMRRFLGNDGCCFACRGQSWLHSCRTSISRTQHLPRCCLAQLCRNEVSRWLNVGNYVGVQKSVKHIFMQSNHEELTLFRRRRPRIWCLDRIRIHPHTLSRLMQRKPLRQKWKLSRTSWMIIRSLLKCWQ